jgi:hypothetical protein
MPFQILGPDHVGHVVAHQAQQRRQLGRTFGGIGKLGRTLGDALLQRLLRRLQGFPGEALGGQGLGLGQLLVTPQDMDAAGQGKGEQQHLQRRTDLHAVGRQRVGRQPVEGPQGQHGHTQQQQAPGRQEDPRGRLPALESQQPTHHGNTRKGRAHQRRCHATRPIGVDHRDQPSDHETHLQKADQPIEPGSRPGRVQKLPGEDRPEETGHTEPHRQSDIPPARGVGPQVLVAEAKHGQLGQRHGSDTGHVHQIDPLPQREIQQQVVDAEGQQHAEIQGQDPIHLLVVLVQGPRRP